MDWYETPDYPEYECPVCGDTTEKEGVCSNTCFEADMM